MGDLKIKIIIGHSQTQNSIKNFASHPQNRKKDR